MQIRMAHIRSAHFCSRGARAWFDRHSLDFNLFLKEGLPESDILGTGDALGVRVVEVAHQMNDSKEST